MTKFTKKEQVIILKQILKNASSQFNHLDLDTRNLAAAKQQVSLILAELEESSEGQKIIEQLKKEGLFRMLYRHASIKGELLPDDDILHQVLRYGFVGVGLSTLSIALFTATALLTVPAWLSVMSTGLFVGSVTYLSGLIYGVINDLFATKANLPYFLLGHQYQQKTLFKTNDPIAQGIAWGVAASFGPVAIASLVFAIVAMITAAFTPVATAILPLMMLAMPLIAIGAEFYAQKRTKELSDEFEYFNPGSNTYQQNGCAAMCLTKTEKAAWYANSDRNLFGFTGVPIIGLGMLIALVACSTFNILPTILLTSSLFTTFLPIACASIGVLGLSLSGLYLYLNQDTQIDNRYKLNFDADFKVIDGLYLDEDEATARNLIHQYYHPRHTPRHTDEKAKETSGWRVFNLFSSNQKNTAEPSEPSTHHAFATGVETS